jgi:hypothetical protein
MSGEIMVVTRAATFDFDGRRIRLVKGKQTARRGHPILHTHGHYFEPLEITFDTEPLASALVPGPRRRQKAEDVIL